MIDLTQKEDKQRAVAALLLACRERDVERELKKRCNNASIEQLLACAKVVCAHIESTSIIDAIRWCGRA